MYVISKDNGDIGTKMKLRKAIDSGERGAMNFESCRRS